MPGDFADASLVGDGAYAMPPPGPAGHSQSRFAPRRSGNKGYGGTRSPAPSWSGEARTPRSALPSRADHAARLLLSHMDFLDTLAHDDHAALCALPPPHGPLFVWLEAQFHEHGVRPWEQLQADLSGHDSAACAVRVMDGAHTHTADEVRELRQELRGLLDRMLVEQIKRQQDEAIAQAAHDPDALERYRALETQRKALLERLGRAAH